MSKSAALLSPPPLPRPVNQLLTSEEFLDWLEPGGKGSVLTIDNEFISRR